MKPKTDMRYLVILMLVVIIGEMTWILIRPEPTPTAGATITTIQGTDTLSNSRGTINTNFANLNTDIATINTSLANVWTFSNATNFGASTQSTTSIPWFRNGLDASSTSQFANASSTLFTTGTFWQTSAATSTFTGGVAMTAFGTTATSSGTKGINLTGGCFAVNGGCIGASGATVGAITASTTIGATQGAITVPANYTLLVNAVSTMNSNGTEIDLKLGGQTVEQISFSATQGPFSLNYATTTATTTTISVISDGSLGTTYITSLLMPIQPLTN